MNAKHASTTLTLVETPAKTACPSWCLRHEDGADRLCIGPRVALNFGEPTPGNSQAVHHAEIITYGEPDGSATLSLILNNGTDSGDFTPTRARQIAAALVQVADATEAGVR